MKYEIYEMVEPEILSETKPSGYDMETTNGIVLQRPKYSTNLDNFYNSEKDAYDAIVENKGIFKYESKNSVYYLLLILDLMVKFIKK